MSDSLCQLCGHARQLQRESQEVVRFEGSVVHIRVNRIHATTLNPPRVDTSYIEGYRSRMHTSSEKPTNPRCAFEFLEHDGDTPILAEVSNSLYRKQICPSPKRVRSILFLMYEPEPEPDKSWESNSFWITLSCKSQNDIYLIHDCLVINHFKRACYPLRGDINMTRRSSGRSLRFEPEKP